jgi:hypothetical protein
MIAKMCKLSFNDKSYTSHSVSPLWFKDRMKPKSIMPPYAETFSLELVEIGARRYPMSVCN